MEDSKILIVALIAALIAVVVGYRTGLRPKHPVRAWARVGLAAFVLVTVAAVVTRSWEIGGFALIWAFLPFVIGLCLKDEPRNLPAAPHFHPEPKDRSRPRLETYNRRGELEHH